MSIILGIDPGTTTVGFAIIKKVNNNYSLIDYGVFLTTPKIDLSVKILEIGADMESIISKYKPNLQNDNLTFYLFIIRKKLKMLQKRIEKPQIRRFQINLRICGLIYYI